MVLYLLFSISISPKYFSVYIKISSLIVEHYLFFLSVTDFEFSYIVIREFWLKDSCICSFVEVYILSGIISPLISSSIFGTYRSGEFLFQYPIIFAFSYCSWGSQGKNTEVVCHSLLQWTTFCQTPPPWQARLGWPHGHGLVSLS